MPKDKATSGKSAPYLLCGDKLPRTQTDLLIALAPLIIFASVIWGPRALLLCAVGGLCAWVTETVFELVLHARLAGISAVPNGIMIALVCPVSAAWWLIALGAFAAAVFKMLMRSFRRPLFHPAAAGWIVMLLLGTEQMSTYPVVDFRNPLPVFGAAGDFYKQDSIGEMLKKGFPPRYTLSQMLTGQVSGAMGATALLLIAACAVFLIYRKRISWNTIFPCLFIVFVAAILTNGNQPELSVLFELSASSLLFSIVFLIPSHGPAPSLTASRMIYGFLCGLLIMIFRLLGFYELSVPVSLIICGIFSVVSEWLILCFKSRGPVSAKKLFMLVVRG